MKKNFLYLLVFILSFYVFSQSQNAGLYTGQGIRSAEEGLAAEEFRRGVQAFYRGSFSDSVLQFEKALNYLPNDNLILDWLGKAYFYAGMESNALQSWEYANNTGYGGLLLNNKIEIVKERRISENDVIINSKLSEAGSFYGINGETLIFSEPISVLPNNDGSLWVLSYASNNLKCLNINGTIIDSVNGPVSGFDRPVDVIRLLNENLVVSESAGDRLSLLSKDGDFIKYIGKKGRKNGELIGPQYIASDSKDNIYVSDYGNKRIVVFDKEGNALFTFGTKSNTFKGLSGPTGIAVLNDSLFVADNVYGAIYEFDLSGNYLGLVVEEKTFKQPESLKVWNNFLVICDSNHVYTVNSQTGSVFENITTGNAPSKLTCAVPDINGNILVTDMKSNEIYVMARIHELVGGLFVQIKRVNAQKFPEVYVDVLVENRHREPIVGLSGENFYLTENKRPVINQRFISASYNDKFADITLIIDRNENMKYFESQINETVRELASYMDKNTTLRIISAGSVPALEYSGKSFGASNFSVSGLKNNYSKNVPLDLAIRLAVNDLINSADKKAIIYISDGSFNQNSFNKYGLSDVSSYMNNNSVSFSMIQINQGSINNSLEYLINNTKGKDYYMFRPEGLSCVIEDITKMPSGIYTFSFTSSLSTNFGEKYLPLEVESYLMNRSGRDESGYFAPLQ